MLVKDLIECLKQCPPGMPVLAKDVCGKPSTYILLRFGPDGVAIDAIPELAQYNLPYDDRYCPGDLETLTDAEHDTSTDRARHEHGSSTTRARHEHGSSTNAVLGFVSSNKNKNKNKE